MHFMGMEKKIMGAREWPTEEGGGGERWKWGWGEQGKRRRQEEERLKGENG